MRALALHPAVVSAVLDALAPLGDMPLWPARVWAATHRQVIMTRRTVAAP